MNKWFFMPTVLVYAKSGYFTNVAMVLPE